MSAPVHTELFKKSKNPDVKGCLIYLHAVMHVYYVLYGIVL